MHAAIVHQNPLFRNCLALAFTNSSRFSAVVEIEDAAGDWLGCLSEPPPDVVLIDLNLPDDLACRLTAAVRRAFETTKVVVLASANNSREIAECIAAGAHGCVADQSSLDSLLAAVEAVACGETFCSPQLAHSLFQEFADHRQQSHRGERIDSHRLTCRELEIVGLIADGASNKQIARELSLSLYTVKNHVHNILEKLQVPDRFEAADFARRRRWLTARSPASAATPPSPPTEKKRA